MAILFHELKDIQVLNNNIIGAIIADDKHQILGLFIVHSNVDFIFGTNTDIIHVNPSNAPNLFILFNLLL